MHAHYDVRVLDRERAPREGPTVFAGNHPNSLLDPYVIGACLDRQLNFVAKSTLFKGPMGHFLRAAGTIPVYRRQDTKDTSGNVRTFASCFEVLEAGGAVGIFPEGLSHTDPQLKQIKTGAARIALEAEEKNDWRLGVAVAPVGLYFVHAPRFRSRVTVKFGEPIAAASFRERYREDPHGAVEDLTARLEESLERLIVHVEKLEQRTIVDDVRRIYLDVLTAPRPGDPAVELLAAQEIARAVHHFIEKDPATASLIARRIRRYLSLVDRLGIHDRFVARRTQEVHLTRESLRLIVWGGILLPVALYGLIVNYVPIRAAYWAGRLLAPSPSVVATARFTAGLVGVLLTYPIEIYLAWRGMSLPAAIAFAVSLPVTGYFAVRYPRLFAVFLDRLRSAVIRKTRRRLVARLRRRRSALLAELDRLRMEYREARPPDAPALPLA